MLGRGGDRIEVPTGRCLRTKADAAPPLLSAFSAQALRAWARRGRVESCLSREADSLGGGDGRRIGLLSPQATQGASPKAPRPPPVAPASLYCQNQKAFSKKFSKKNLLRSRENVVTVVVWRM